MLPLIKRDFAQRRLFATGKIAFVLTLSIKTLVFALPVTHSMLKYVYYITIFLVKKIYFSVFKLYTSHVKLYNVVL